MLNKFSLFVHWLGFISAVFFGFLFIGTAIKPEYSDNSILLSLLGVFACVACSGLGWLARYVLVGKINFLPWKISHDQKKSEP